MHGLLADSSGGAWSFSSSMITFVFPMMLVIVIAAALYVLYTKRELIPGQQPGRPARSVSDTATPGTPAARPGDGA